MGPGATAFGSGATHGKLAGLGVTMEPAGRRGFGATDLFSNTLWQLLMAAGTAAGAYHGYKRNESVGWAVAWGFLGGMAPVIVVPIALAQGFGKPKRS